MTASISLGRHQSLRVEIRHVPLVDGDAGALAERLGALVVAHVVRGDLIARVFQPHRDRLADAARATGDDRYPSCHEMLPDVRVVV